MKKKYLEAGKIVSTHGVRGELRVQSWCDSPEILCSLNRLYSKNGEKMFRVENSRVHKTLVLLKLEGIDTVEKADAMRNHILFLDRDDITLPDGAHFIQDLIGLKVLDADTGKEYGDLTDVFQTGANDVYEITDKNGKKTLIPVIPIVVINTDIDSGIIEIRPLEGLFQDEN